MAEGMGFEPMNPLSQVKRLAGARTRPLCDPSLAGYMLSNGYISSNTRACAHHGGPGEGEVKNGGLSFPITVTAALNS